MKKRNFLRTGHLIKLEEKGLGKSGEQETSDSAEWIACGETCRRSTITATPHKSGLFSRLAVFNFFLINFIPNHLLIFFFLLFVFLCHYEDWSVDCYKKGYDEAV